MFDSDFFDTLTAYLPLITVICAIVGAVITIYTYVKNSENRKVDLEWKRSDAADKAIREIHTNLFSLAAVEMLDWHRTKIPLKNYNEEGCVISFEEVIEAINILTTEQSLKNLDDKQVAILDSFDWFFYFVDRIQQNIQYGFFDFDHVKYVFLPYYLIMFKNSHKNLFTKYMALRKYFLAPIFWQSFDFWNYPTINIELNESLATRNI